MRLEVDHIEVFGPESFAIDCARSTCSEQVISVPALCVRLFVGNTSSNLMGLLMFDHEVRLGLPHGLDIFLPFFKNFFGFLGSLTSFLSISKENFTLGG